MSKPVSKLTAKETAVWLCEQDGFLVLTHKRPDGDAIGSACGLVRALRKVGKTAFIYPNPEITPRYAPFAADYLAPQGYAASTVVSVDMASLGMFPKGAEAYRDRVALAIDHHESHEAYADMLYLEGDSASCGELIYLVAAAMDCDIDKELADLLYVAVSTDTGCFRQANATARSLEIGAKLVYAGADNVSLNRKLFEMKSRARVAVEAAIMGSLRLSSEGGVAVARLTLADIERIGATEDDMDNISSIVQQVEGVVCGALVREKADGCKVSVRSSGGFNASKLCARFGGGGHSGAAGCEIGAAPDEVVKMIENAAAEELDQ